MELDEQGVYSNTTRLLPDQMDMDSCREVISFSQADGVFSC